MCTPKAQQCHGASMASRWAPWHAGLFEQAVALAPTAEEGYFAYPRYLDQPMRDARERQEKARAARAEAQARTKEGPAFAQPYDVSRDDRLGGKSR